MDVHLIENGIYRYWPIPISTSYPKASADPASSSTSCWTSDGNCVFFLILEPGEENSPQLPKVKDWENQQMSIPKKENIGVYVTCIHVYVYLYIYRTIGICPNRGYTIPKKNDERRPVRSFPFRGPPWSWWPESKSHDFYPIHPYFFSMNHYDSPRLSMVNIMSMIHKNVD